MGNAHDVKQLHDHALQLQENTSKHANHVPLLLSKVESCSDEATLHAVLKALSTFFVAAFDAGHLQSNPSKTGEGSAKAKSVYSSWLARQLSGYVACLCALMRRECTTEVQRCALAGVMESVRGANPGQFGTTAFWQLLDSLLRSRHVKPELMAKFIATYLPLADVRLYTLKWIKNVCEGRMESREAGTAGPSAEEEEEAGGEVSAGGWQLSGADQARNLYDVLVRLVPQDEEDAAEMASWTKVAEAGAAAPAVSVSEGSKARRKKRKRLAEGAQAGAQADAGSRESVHVQWANPKIQKKAFSTAWLAFLRTRLPADLYRKVLLRCHSDIIPHMTHPVLLSDFLTRAVQKGGLTALMALNSVFLLVTQHGLEYPHFYQQLYALITPDTFKAKYKARFFTLLDVFLASGKVPAYSAAAFAKRLARLALTAPPAGAMIAIAFIHNILRNHRSCNVILHNPLAPATAPPSAIHQNPHKTNGNPEGFGTPSSSDDDDDADVGVVVGDDDHDSGAKREQSGGLANGCSSHEGQGRQGGTAGGTGPAGGAAGDVFIEDDDNPETCRAIESSLWEIEALQNHYSPQVAAFASVLDKDLTDRSKNADIDIAPLVNDSYVSLIQADLAKRLKKVATAFYPRPPNKLFDINSSKDFAGWAI